MDEELKAILWSNAKRVAKWFVLIAVVFGVGYQIGDEKGYHRGRHKASEYMLRTPVEALSNRYGYGMSDGFSAQYAMSKLNHFASYGDEESKRVLHEVFPDDEIGVAFIKAWRLVIEAAENEKRNANTRTSGD